MPPKRKVASQSPPASPPTYFARLPADMRNYLVEALERSEFPAGRKQKYLEILEEERHFDIAMRPVAHAGYNEHDALMDATRKQGKEGYQFRRELLGDNAKRVTQVQAHIKKVTFKKKNKGKASKK